MCVQEVARAPISSGFEDSDIALSLYVTEGFYLFACYFFPLIYHLLYWIAIAGFDSGCFNMASKPSASASNERFLPSTSASRILVEWLFMLQLVPIALARVLPLRE